MGQSGFEFVRGAWREVRPRIGHRHPVGISVQWKACVSQPTRRRRRRSKVEQGQAVAVDMSVSGARIALPLDTDFIRGSRFELEVDGEWAMVLVAWIKPANGTAALFCGVMYLLPSPEFIAAVARVLDGSPANPR